MAGSILESQLVYNGRGFPSIFICENDQRHLFDVEMKLKLHNIDSIRLLTDLVVNFPGPALLQSTSLIRTILDELGANCAIVDEFRTNSYCVALISVLTGIMRSCEEAMELITTEDSFTSSESRIESITSVPIPSYGGFAFACCAAALPLLQFNDIEVAFAVRQLFVKCVKHFLETPQLNSTSSQQTLNERRIQHLLNRFNQLFSIINNDPSATSISSILISSSQKSWEDQFHHIHQAVHSFILLDMFAYLVEENNLTLKASQYVVGKDIAWFLQFMLTNPISLTKLHLIRSSSLHTFLDLYHHETYEICQRAVQLAQLFGYFISKQEDEDGKRQKMMVPFEELEMLYHHLDIFYTALNKEKEGFQVTNYVNVEITMRFVVLQTFLHTPITDVSNPLQTIQRLHLLLYYGTYPVKTLLLKYLLYFSTTFQNEQTLSFVMQSFCTVEILCYLCYSVLQCYTHVTYTAEYGVYVDQVLLVLDHYFSSMEYDLTHTLFFSSQQLHWLAAVVWCVVNRPSSSISTNVIEKLKNALSEVEENQNDGENEGICWYKVMGMFHATSHIRMTSIEYLYRHVLCPRYGCEYHTTEELKDPFEGKISVLQDIPSINQNDLNKLVIESKKIITNITHKDLRNLVSNSFSSLSSMVMKCASVNQLINHLTNDIILLNSCTIQWVNEVAHQIISALTLEICGPSSTSSPPPATTSAASAILSVLENMDKFRSDFCVYCMHLLLLFAKQFPSDLSFTFATSSSSSSGSDDIDVSLFVYILIHFYHLRNQLTSSNIVFGSSGIGGEGIKFVDKMIHSSATLLHFLCFNTFKWSLQRGKYDVTSLSPNSTTYAVPEFLAQEIQYSVVAKTSLFQHQHNTLSALYLPRLATILFIPPHTYLVPSEKLLTTAIYDQTGRSIYHTFPQTVQSLLSNAMTQDHFSFLRIAKTTCCCCTLFDQVNTVFAKEKENKISSIFQSVTRIIQKVPTTQKDKHTFLLALRLLRVHIQCLVRSSNTSDALVLHSIISSLGKLDLYHATMLSLLEQLKMSKDDREKEIGKDARHQQASWLFDVIAEFLQVQLFIMSTTASTSSDRFFAHDPNLKLTMIRMITAEILWKEEYIPHYLRLLAAKVIEQLLHTHFNYFITACNTIPLPASDNNDPTMMTTQSDNALKMLMNLTKLLRLPDSYQYHAVTVVSLRLLSLFISKLMSQDTSLAAASSLLWECIYWQWSVRLLYHVSTEVKLLALHTIQLILPRTFASSIPIDAENWPPVQPLYYLMIDEGGMLTVRTKCAEVLMTLIGKYQVDFPLGIHKLWSKYVALVNDCFHPNANVGIDVMLSLLQGMIVLFYQDQTIAGITSKEGKISLMAIVQFFLRYLVKYHSNHNDNENNDNLVVIYRITLLRFLFTLMIQEGEEEDNAKEKDHNFYLATTGEYILWQDVCQYLLLSTVEILFIHHSNSNSKKCEYWQDCVQFNALANIVILILSRKKLMIQTFSSLMMVLNTLLTTMKRGLVIHNSIKLHHIAHEQAVNQEEEQQESEIDHEFVSSCCSLLTAVLQLRSYCNSLGDNHQLLSAFDTFSQCWIIQLALSQKKSKPLSVPSVNLTIKLSYLLVHWMEQSGTIFVDCFITKLFTKQSLLGGGTKGRQQVLPWELIITTVQQQCLLDTTNSDDDDHDLNNNDHISAKGGHHKVKLSESKWRKRVRSFTAIPKKKQPNHKHLPPSPSSLNQVNGLLWSCCIVLKPMLPVITSNHPAAEDHVKQLVKFLKSAFQLTMTNSLSIAFQSNQSASYSLGRFAACIWTLLTVVLCSNNNGEDQLKLRKELLSGFTSSMQLSSGQNSSSGGGGGLAHQLVSIFVNPGFVESIRYLALQICIQQLLLPTIQSSSSSTSSSSLKINTIQVISQFIRDRLQQPGKPSSNKLNAVTLHTTPSSSSSSASIASEVFHALFGLFCLTNATASVTESHSSHDHRIPLHELIDWFADQQEQWKQRKEFQHYKPLFALLIRFVAFPYIFHKQSTTAHRVIENNKLLALMLQTLYYHDGQDEPEKEEVGETEDNVIQMVSAMSLWSILLHSEKMKTTIKELLLQYQGQGSMMSGQGGRRSLPMMMRSSQESSSSSTSALSSSPINNALSHIALLLNGGE